MSEIYVPALRGLFGDWVYYSCIFPISEVDTRIDYADSIHKSKNLSELIQRELKSKRGKEIAEYLENDPERFFNSLVVAVYGGEPMWYPSNITPDEKINQDSVSEDALNTIGFLRLSGSENLFAIDGQHRLAGIKAAIKANPNTFEDEVSVLMVAHRNSPEGLIRTRRLFTVLNKKAVVVSKGELIALDENDIMAIITRRLIQDSTLFSGDRIAIKATNNIADRDEGSITTIGNLYDLLGIIFSKIKQKHPLQKIKNSARPNDEEIERYFSFTETFFKDMFTAFKPLQEFSIPNCEKTAVKKYRGKHGGSVLYRPLGLAIVLELIANLVVQGESYQDAMTKVAKLKLDLNDPPFVNTFWDPTLGRIETKNKVLARDCLLVSLGVIKSPAKVKKIEQKYEQVTGAT